MSSGDASARGREHARACTLSIFIFKVTNIQRRLYCMAGALHKIENSSVALVTRTFLQTHFFKTKFIQKLLFFVRCVSMISNLWKHEEILPVQTHKTGCPSPHALSQHRELRTSSSRNVYDVISLFQFFQYSELKKKLHSIIIYLCVIFVCD